MKPLNHSMCFFNAPADDRDEAPILSFGRKLWRNIVGAQSVILILNTFTYGPQGRRVIYFSHYKGVDTGHCDTNYVATSMRCIQSDVQYSIT